MIRLPEPHTKDCFPLYIALFIPKIKELVVLEISLDIDQTIILSDTWRVTVGFVNPTQTLPVLQLLLNISLAPVMVHKESAHVRSIAHTRPDQSYLIISPVAQIIRLISPLAHLAPVAPIAPVAPTAPATQVAPVAQVGQVAQVAPAAHCNH